MAWSITEEVFRWALYKMKSYQLAPIVALLVHVEIWDYSILNTVLTDNPCPTFRILLLVFTERKFFPKLIWQMHIIHMVKENIAKNAIRAYFELFTFLQMLFGLKNAAQIFQQLLTYHLYSLTLMTFWMPAHEQNLILNTFCFFK